MNKDWRKAGKEIEEARKSLVAFTAAFVPPATRDEVLAQIKLSGAYISHFSHKASYDELVQILVQIRWMQSQEQAS